MKIGRNEKCPCGSGLKYKYCCIHKPEPDPPLPPGEPDEQFYGYNRDRTEDESPFDYSTDGLCCLVTKLNDILAEPLNHPEQDIQFKADDYIVTSGDCENTLIEGPFDRLDTAFEVARDKFGAVRFMSKPEFFF